VGTQGQINRPIHVWDCSRYFSGRKPAHQGPNIKSRDTKPFEVLATAIACLFEFGVPLATIFIVMVLRLLRMPLQSCVAPEHSLDVLVPSTTLMETVTRRGATSSTRGD